MIDTLAGPSPGYYAYLVLADSTPGGVWPLARDCKGRGQDSRAMRREILPTTARLGGWTM